MASKKKKAAVPNVKLGVLRLLRKREALDDAFEKDLAKLKDRYKVLTAVCKHVWEHAREKSYSNTGNYDPTADYYMRVEVCAVCQLHKNTETTGHYSDNKEVTYSSPLSVLF